MELPVKINSYADHKSLGQRKNQLIWDGGPAREIMELSKAMFDFMVERAPVFAHVERASDHYSLVKRYLSPAPFWLRHLAVWHMWRAMVHAKLAFQYNVLDSDQTDVVSTILVKAPKWLGGDPHGATRLINKSLLSKKEMSPHTKAFLLIRYGDAGMKLGKSSAEVAKYYDEAEKLVPQIVDERQKCRVLAAIGFFRVDHFKSDSDIALGMTLVANAAALSRKVSKDQHMKIEAEMQKRGMLIRY